jgi:hypothetical protein
LHNFNEQKKASFAVLVSESDAAHCVGSQEMKTKDFEVHLKVNQLMP